jgi:hypothetical protein
VLINKLKNLPVFGDIRWEYIDLYRTAAGKYFLHGSGGPGSNVANCERISTAWGDEFFYTSGEAIIPMSQHDIIVWGYENLPDNILKKILKDIQEREKQKNAEISEILKLFEKKLSMRQRKIKIGLTYANATAEVQARQAKYYEQFVEL